jgi:GNAT superfamily N-acetyltransferase
VDDVKCAVYESQMPLYLLDPALFEPFEVSPPYLLRQLSAAYQPAFEAFLAQCTQADRDEGDIGIDHMIAFGVFDGARIAAASSVFIWRGFIDMGILTDPAYRGRGFGKALVSACISHYLQGDCMIGYRHDSNNIASEKLALSLGFRLYGMADIVKLQRA